MVFSDSLVLHSLHLGNNFKKCLDPAVDSIRQIREALPVKEVPESHVS